MKKIFATMLFAVVAMTASAQIGSVTSRGVVKTESGEPFFLSRIQWGYQAQYYSYDYSGMSSVTNKWNMWGHGATLGYIAGLRVLPKKPLYVTFGVVTSLTFGSKHEKIYTYSDSKYNYYTNIENGNTRMTVEVPFGISYRLQLGHSGIYFSPHAGFHLKFIPMWLDDEGDSYFNNKYYDPVANRVQFGGQVGFNFDLRKFYLGFEYTGDFNSMYKYNSYKISGDALRVNMGVVF